MRLRRPASRAERPVTAGHHPYTAAPANPYRAVANRSRDSAWQSAARRG
ncbi:hypothetical protein ACL02O_15205 [Micromonospora sp. MS34]